MQRRHTTFPAEYTGAQLADDQHAWCLLGEYIYLHSRLLQKGMHLLEKKDAKMALSCAIWAVCWRLAKLQLLWSARAAADAWPRRKCKLQLARRHRAAPLGGTSWPPSGSNQSISNQVQEDTEEQVLIPAPAKYGQRTKKKRKQQQLSSGFGRNKDDKENQQLAPCARHLPVVCSSRLHYSLPWPSAGPPVVITAGCCSVTSQQNESTIEKLRFLNRRQNDQVATLWTPDARCRNDVHLLLVK